MTDALPLVGKYTFEKPYGFRHKDPINIAFVGLLDGMVRVEDIMKSLGYGPFTLVSSQYFAEPDDDAPFKRRQDINVATRFLGLGGREHVRLYHLSSTAGVPPTIVGAVHHERWPEVFGPLRKACDAVDSFDAPRNVIQRRLEGRFATKLLDFKNINPMVQCDRAWVKGDGKILIVSELSDA